MDKEDKKGCNSKEKHIKKGVLLLEEKEKLIQEKDNELLRLKAEFENYKKHLDKEKEYYIKNANESLIKELLNILDDFERAISELKKEKRVDVSGVELLYKNFYKTLENCGLRRIDCIGKKLDPYYHDVMLQEERDDGEDGKIIEELQKGYMINDKVIRHAKVKVLKKKGK